MATSYLEALTQRREKGARQANLGRETEVRGIWDDMIRRSEGGGAFRKSEEARIGREFTQEKGLGIVGLLDSGMYSTTNQASVLQRAGESQSAKTGTLESVLEQMTNRLKLGKASFIERIEDPYPDYSQLVQATAAQQSTPSSYGQYRPLPTLGGGGYGSTYAAGKSPGQLSLATRNKAAREEREKRATWGTLGT